jgi:hypothetical protein
MSGRLMPRMVVTMGSDVRERRKATCQHCGEQLEEVLVGGWWYAVNRDHSPVCIPAEYGRQPVRHTPMPDGLRGAPE